MSQIQKEHCSLLHTLAYHGEVIDDLSKNRLLPGSGLVITPHIEIAGIINAKNDGTPLTTLDLVIGLGLAEKVLHHLIEQKGGFVYVEELGHMLLSSMHQCPRDIIDLSGTSPTYERIPHIKQRTITDLKIALPTHTPASGRLIFESKPGPTGKAESVIKVIWGMPSDSIVQIPYDPLVRDSRRDCTTSEFVQARNEIVTVSRIDSLDGLTQFLEVLKGLNARFTSVKEKVVTGGVYGYNDRIRTIRPTQDKIDFPTRKKVGDKILFRTQPFLAVEASGLVHQRQIEDTIPRDVMFAAVQEIFAEVFNPNFSADYSDLFIFHDLFGKMRGPKFNDPSVLGKQVIDVETNSTELYELVKIFFDYLTTITRKVSCRELSQVTQSQR